MGCRGQVKIISQYKDEKPIYLYTHWGADRLADVVRDAMDRGRGRWTHSEYLARIIFSDMIKDNIDGETGYGIGTGEHGDIEKLITVNLADASVEIRDVYSGKVAIFSFDDFTGGLQ